jgi:hypothetical protein
VKLLFLLLVAGGAVMLPFVFLKRPWAVRLWGKLRLVVMVYIVVIVVSAAVRLFLNWDDIYG